MKTYLITPLCQILQDTPGNRKQCFHEMSEWTGDEWTSHLREEFANRYVSEDTTEEEDLEPEEWSAIKGKPWTVSWDDSDRSPTETTEVARFATEEEAQSFAKLENRRRLISYIQNDGNFTIFHLPDEIEPEVSTVKQGRYPLSRNATCYLTHNGITVESTANWTAKGIRDDWPNQQTILETIIDLIPDLIAATVEQATCDPATA